MPDSASTLEIIRHLDEKFAEADRKRSNGLEVVHRKIDEHAREARESLDGFRTETTAALGALSVQLGKHDTRIGAIESGRSKEDAKAEGRMLAAAKILLSGGGLAALYEFLLKGKQ